MKKLLSIIVSMVMLSGLLAGCSSTPAATTVATTAEAAATTTAKAATEDTTAAATTASEKVFKVGYCINNFNDTFQTYIEKAVEDYIKVNPDLTLVTADAQEDVVKQQDQVNTFIAQGVDALIVVPVDTSAMDPITQAAQDAGIPLCYVNRNPYSGKEDSMPKGVYYVGSQEIKAGEMQMQYAGELLAGKGGICILEGQLTNEGAVKRTQGVQDTATATFPDIKILALETGNWQRDQGMSLTENWITKFGDTLNCVLANNDEMALGAVEALQAAGRTDVIVMGVDAIPDALQAVKEGTLAGTVLQDAVGQGEGSIKVIQSVLKGGTSESVIWIDFQLVTPENIDTFLK